MLNKYISAIFVVLIAVVGLYPNLAQAQLWLQFAHPNQRHLDEALRDPNVYLSTPDLVNTSADVTITRPVLVILMEFSDVTHENTHTVAFYRELYFGNPRPGNRPSVAEIYRENSNGRMLLAPATNGDTHGQQDGIVGWVATSKTFQQLIDTHVKRAEAIRLAAPSFDYSQYDEDDDGLITSDELVVVVINADDTACDQHDGHANLPGCTNQAGGNVRTTEPKKVAFENSDVEVYQQVAGLVEQADVGVTAHEIAHQMLGHGDLYENGHGKPSHVHVADGYEYNNIWYPPPPLKYSIMDKSDPEMIPHLDPWAKIHHGFVKPRVVTHDGTYTLYDAETERNFAGQSSQPEALIIYDPLKQNPYREYFILENRNDPELDDQGLAVWLINETSNNWPLDLKFRQVVRFIRREGHWPTLWFADSLSLWNGINEIHGYDLTATSTPRNTNWTDGSRSYIEVTDISPAGSAMTFKVTMPPIFVDKANSGSENGSQNKPFNTVLEGINAIPESPRTVRIAGGSYLENLILTTPLTLKGWRNGNAIIGQ